MLHFFGLTTLYASHEFGIKMNNNPIRAGFATTYASISRQKMGNLAVKNLDSLTPPILQREKILLSRN